MQLLQRFITCCVKIYSYRPMRHLPCFNTSRRLRFCQVVGGGGGCDVRLASPSFSTVMEALNRALVFASLILPSTVLLSQQYSDALSLNTVESSCVGIQSLWRPGAGPDVRSRKDTEHKANGTQADAHKCTVFHW